MTSLDKREMTIGRKSGMAQIFIWSFCFLLVPFLLAACEGNSGYTRTVTMPAAGGTKVIRGDKVLHSLGMSTFNGSTEGLVKEKGEDSIRMSMHWLK